MPLTSDQRLALIQHINVLLPPEFESLVVALSVPHSVLSSSANAQGNRVAELIRWVEGLNGCGMDEFLNVLGQIAPLPDELRPPSQNTQSTRAEAVLHLTARLSEDNQIQLGDRKIEVQTLVAHLEALIGTQCQLTIKDIESGSVKITLEGSVEDLQKITDLFQSGILTEIEGIPIEKFDIVPKTPPKVVVMSSTAERKVVVETFRRGIAPLTVEREVAAETVEREAAVETATGRLKKKVVLASLLMLLSVVSSIYFGRPTPDLHRNEDPTVITSKDNISLFDNPTDEKENGVEELARTPPNYAAAIEAFVQSLQQEPNDPETLVLLNNAIASSSQWLDPVDIATALPLHVQDTSLEILRGIAQSQIEFNCGSINVFVDSIEAGNTPRCSGTQGKMLRVEMAGSKEAQNNLKVAEYLASQTSIVAVIGHFSSTASLQVMPTYIESDLVTISPTATSTELSNYRNFFRTVPSDAVAAKDLAEYATNELGLGNVAISYISDGSSKFSLSFAEEFRKYLPNDSFVYGEDCDLSDPVGFKAADCIAAANTNGAEAILLVPETSPELLAALELAGVDSDLIFLGADSLYNSRTLDAFSGSDQQIWVAVAWHRSDSAFEQDAIKLYKRQINWRSAMSYDAVQVVGGVLRQSSGVPSRQEFLNKLTSLRDTAIADGAAGPIIFDANGDRVLDSGLSVLVTIGPSGGFVPVEE